VGAAATSPPTAGGGTCFLCGSLLSHIKNPVEGSSLSSSLSTKVVRLVSVALPEFGQVKDFSEPAVVNIPKEIFQTLKEDPLKGLLHSLRNTYKEDPTFKSKKRTACAVGEKRMEAAVKLLNGALAPEVTRAGRTVPEDAPPYFKRFMATVDLMVHDIGSITNWAPGSHPYVIVRVEGAATFLLNSAANLDVECKKMTPPQDVCAAGNQVLAQHLQNLQSTYEVHVEQGQALYIPPGFLVKEQRAKAAITLRGAGFPLNFGAPAAPEESETMKKSVLANLEAVKNVYPVNENFRDQLKLLEGAP
jgi:hypothetical protein